MHDAEQITLVLCVEAPPPALIEALEDGRLAHEAYDFKCDLHRSYAVYHVQAHGAVIPVVAHTTLIDREDRVALIRPPLPKAA
jgi:hypothetical protein